MSRKKPSTFTTLVAIAWRALTSTIERRKHPTSPPEPALPPAPAEAVIEPVVLAPEAKIAVEPELQQPPPPKAPACPHCKKLMVMKVARTGRNAGGNFWGCGDYPKCRGIRAIYAPMGQA